MSATAGLSDGPPMTEEDARILRDMVLYRPARDPVRGYAERRLARAGLLGAGVVQPACQQGGEPNARGL